MWRYWVTGIVSVSLFAGGFVAPTASAAPPTCLTPGIYSIDSEIDLRALATTVACHATGLTFVQSADIDLTSAWTPIGTSSSPFHGTYDGNNKKIRALSIPAAGENSGLFGYTLGATITGVHLEGVSISGAGASKVGALIGFADGTTIQNSSTAGSVSGTNAVGGLVGGLVGTTARSTLSNSYASGAISGVGNVGGLVGAMTDSTLSNTYASGSVTGTGTSVGGLVGEAATGIAISQSFSTGAVAGVDYVGGLVGKSGQTSRATSIQDSFASGSVTGAWQVGGLIGKNESQVSRSYASGPVTGTGDVGGFGGQNYGDLFTDVVWNPTTTLQSSPGLNFNVSSTPRPPISATALDSTQMRSGSSFSGWNFSSVWGFQCGVSNTPELRWANPLATSTSAGPCSSPVPEPAPIPAPAPTPTPVPTQQSEPTATPTPVQTVDPPVRQDPGTSSMLIGGQEIEVQKEEKPRGLGVTVSAGPVTVAVRSTTPTGQSVPVAADGSLVLARSGEVPIEASGLEPGSVVTQTLFSDPVDLGSTIVDSSGNFTSAPKIPATTPVGSHTLSVRGTTNTGDAFSLDIGVIVATPAVALGADPVLIASYVRQEATSEVRVAAEGVQARCLVTFTAGKQKARERASSRGTAQSTLTLRPSRPGAVKVTMRVSGKGCVTRTASTTARGTGGSAGRN